MSSRFDNVPRGLVTRSLIAAGLFTASVVPGWTLGDLAEQWTGWTLLDWVITCGWSSGAVYVLAPHSSYRRRDAVLGLVPLFGWYLNCVLAWRVALLPFRDWEPRADELWRARWLTGDLVGLWRADPLPAPVLRRRPDRDRPRRTAAADAAADADADAGERPTVPRLPIDGDTVPVERHRS